MENDIRIRPWEHPELPYRALDQDGADYYYADEPYTSIGVWRTTDWQYRGSNATVKQAQMEWAAENWKNSLQTWAEYLKAINQL
jgi:hypothetical protein